MKALLTYFILTLFLFTSCHHEVPNNLDYELAKLIGDHSKFILPSSTDFSKIPQSPSNPLTQEKVELGKLLFFEPNFANEAKYEAGMGTFTCSTCHVVESGFRPGRMQGIADGGQGFGHIGERRYKSSLYADQDIDAQGARPLAVLNVAFVENTMWNGSFGHTGPNATTRDAWGVTDTFTALNNLELGALEGQNIAGLEVHRMMYNKQTITRNNYKALFDKAFPDMDEEERYSRKAASFALSAYLRALLTDEAPFQRWLKGDKTAMSDQEKKGAILFFGKVGCVSCHNGPNLGSMQFAALGVDDLFEHGGIKTNINDARNLGRGGFTLQPEDLYKFRVPQLYNLGDSGPYFHGGSKNTLEEVVRYFNNGIPENKRVPQSQLAPYLRPLNMTEQEIKDMTAFLAKGLRDPNLQRYKPTSVLSGACFPNNDLESQIDLDCR
ncbi:MAG: cytochrome c peroxidase [Saprospiraceae bacterium]